MAALAESGRSKLDIEVSYSTSDRPAGLSTAEFGNHSRQETQQQQQQPKLQAQSQPQKMQQHQQQQPQQPPPPPQRSHVANACQQSSLGTKLRSVPLSVAFDLSVFATHDRQGRLTLHPVLRTADAVALSAADSGEGGDLGRNNCAKASILVRYPQAEGGRGCHRQEQLPAESDFSTASRVSGSGAAAAATVGAAAADKATAETPRAEGSGSGAEYAAAWPDLPPQHMYMHLHDKDSCAEGSGRISGISGSSICCSGSNMTAVFPAAGGPQLKNHHHHHQQKQQQKLKQKTTHRQHHHQCHHPSCWVCQSALPKFTAIPNQPTSSTSNNSTSSRRHRHHQHHHQHRRGGHHRSSSSSHSSGGASGGASGSRGGGLSAGSLVRIVRRLETLLGRAEHQHQHQHQHQQHQHQQHQHQQHQQRRGRGLASPLTRDLQVSDLRQEYATLFRG